jgi:hypothetical protein
MANLRGRSLRAAFVDCAPPLARIHERIVRALGALERGSYGEPGGGCVSPVTGRNGWPIIPCISAGPVGPVMLYGTLSGDFADGNVNEESEFGVRYFLEEWLSKLDDGKPSPAKAATTWDRFHQAEESCRTANHVIRSWRKSPYEQEINLARRICDTILGPFSWDFAAKGFGWGPGATTRIPRRKSDAAHKYCGTPQTTIGNAILANAVLKYNPLWSRELPDLTEDQGVGKCFIVPGNRIVTVPKNYKTDRTIAIEPDMNIFVQKGIGGYMRSRLQRAGIDLNDQTRNQRGAFIGSLSGLLATIDMSMASDTISRSVVDLLIRPDWADALGQSRSPFGVLPSGEKIFYQKFSSMGNGYTFELETLIFYSLSLAVTHLLGLEVARVSVYGDDVIVPSAAVERLNGLLSFLGFTPNEKKSYSTGRFRESCGKHYYHGHDVTPFYVKKPPTTLLDLFKLHNQIFRFEKRAESWLGPHRLAELKEVRRWLRSYAPARWRKPLLLEGIGDGAFVGEFDEVLPSRAPRGWDGWICDSIVTIPVHDESLDSHGLLVKSLGLLERSSGKPRCLFTDPEESRVLPVMGERYRVAKQFVSASLARQQCTCSSCLTARGILAE